MAPNVDARQSLASLGALSGVGRISAAQDLNADIPGVSGSRVEAWSSDTRWLGYRLVDGRWFTGPQEVVIPSELQLMTGLRLGDRLTIRVGPSTLHPTIVGVIFDPGHPAWVNLDARTLVGATAQSAVFTTAFIAVTPQSQPDTVAAAADQVDGVHAEVIGANQDDTAYLIIEGVLVALTAVVATVSALGVFNTVVLSPRERRRHLAILKAIGMEPRQLMLMVITTTMAIGLVAGALAIPAGIALHRTILGAMAGIAATDIPSSFYNVYSWESLPLLALGGVAIAALGAAAPARWTARQSVSAALRAE